MSGPGRPKSGEDPKALARARQARQASRDRAAGIERIHVKVLSETAKKIRELAKKKGLTMGQLLDEILKKWPPPL